MAFRPVSRIVAHRSKCSRPRRRLQLEALEPRSLLAGSITGTVFSDVNGDGTRQTGEASLGNVPVFLDLNGNGRRDSATKTFRSDRVDERIPLNPAENNSNGEATPLLSPLTVASFAGLKPTKVTAKLEIDHPAGGMMTVNLISARNFELSLFDNTTARGINATFDDTLGSDNKVIAPKVVSTPGEIIIGTFGSTFSHDIPTPMSYLNDGDVNGIWNLKVIDFNNYINGGADPDTTNHSTLRGWSITVTFDEPQVTANAQGAYTFPGVPDDQYTVVPVLSSAVWALTTGTAARTFTVAGDTTAPGIGIQVPSVSGTVTTGGVPALAGFPVWMDLNSSGTYERDEPLTATDIRGNFAFTDLSKASAGTYSLRIETSRLWRLEGDAPSVTLPGDNVNLNFTLVTTLPAAHPAPFDAALFDVSPVEQAMLERVNQIRANPRGVLGAESFKNTPVFQQRIDTLGQGVTAEWDRVVSAYPNSLQPLGWELGLMTAAAQQAEQNRDLAARRQVLTPRYVPAMDTQNQAVRMEDIIATSGPDLPALFQRLFGGLPTSEPGSGVDAEVGTYQFIARFEHDNAPGLATLRGYGQTAEAAVSDYLSRYWAYVSSLNDPNGVAHWIPEGRYGDSFALRSNRNGGTGGAEYIGGGAPLKVSDGLIVDPPSSMFTLSAPYETIQGTAHGMAFVDPRTRYLGVGTAVDTWSYLRDTGGQFGAFNDLNKGNVYSPQVLGSGVTDRAYVLGVVYQQTFFDHKATERQFSYLDPNSSPLAGLTVQMVASAFEGGEWVPFSNQTTRTWTGGGYQFEVTRPPASRSSTYPEIRVHIWFGDDPSTTQEVFMKIDRLTADPQTGNPGNLLNLKVDQPFAAVVAPVFTTAELIGINEAFSASGGLIRDAFGLLGGTASVPAARLVSTVRAEVQALAAQIDGVFADSEPKRRIVGGAIRDMLVGRGPGSLLTILTTAARDVAAAGPRRQAERLARNADRIENAIEQANSSSLALLNVYYGNTNEFDAGLTNPDATADSPQVVRTRQRNLLQAIDQEIASIQQTVWGGLAPSGRVPGELHARLQIHLTTLAGRVEPILRQVPNYVPVVQTADDTPLMDILITENFPGNLRSALGRLPASNPAGGLKGWATRRVHLHNTQFAMSTFRRQMRNILGVAEAVLPPRRS